MLTPQLGRIKADLEKKTPNEMNENEKALLNELIQLERILNRFNHNEKSIGKILNEGIEIHSLGPSGGCPCCGN